MRTSHFAVLLAVFIVSTTLAAPFQTIRDDFMVSNDIGSTARVCARAAVDRHGNFVVAWMAYIAPGQRRIRYRRFNSAGIPLAPEIKLEEKVYQSYTFAEDRFRMAMTDSGDLAFAWKSGPNDLLLARLHRDDVALDAETVKINQGSTVRDLDIAFGVGTVLVAAWHEGSALMAATISPASPPVIARRSVASNGGHLRIAADRNHQFVVVRQMAGFTLQMRQFDYRSGLVATGDSIAVSADAVSGHSVACYPDGRTVIVWQTMSYPPVDIKAQRFSATRQPVGAAMMIQQGATSSGYREDPALVICANGSFMAAWPEPDIGWGRLSYRVLAESGTPLTPRITISESAFFHPHTVSVGAAPAGQGTVVWMDQHAGYNDVFFQRISAAGVLAGTNTRANGQGSNAAYPVVSVSRTDSLCAAVWDTPDIGKVFAQLYNGPFLGIRTTVPVNEGSQGRRPSIAVMDTSVLVVWQDLRSGVAAPSIYGQRLRSNGLLQGTNFRLSALGDSCAAPGAAALGNIAMSVWEQRVDSTPGKNEVRAILIRDDATPVRSSWRVNTESGACSNPRVGGGGTTFAVVWTTTTSGGIFTQASRAWLRTFARNTGDPLGSAVAVSTSSASSRHTVVDVDSAGSVTVAWLDSRAGMFASQVYWRRFDRTGAPLGNDIRADTGETSKFTPSVAVSNDGLVLLCWVEGANNARMVVSRVFSPDGTPLTGVRTHNQRVIPTNAVTPAVAAGASRAFIVWTSANPLAVTERDIWGEWTGLQADPNAYRLIPMTRLSVRAPSTAAYFDLRGCRITPQGESIGSLRGEGIMFAPGKRILLSRPQ